MLDASPTLAFKLEPRFALLKPGVCLLVLERPGPVFSPRLRLLCVLSTPMLCFCGSARGRWLEFYAWGAALSTH